ncbi:VC0807 family protein [Nocardioides hwasunensis]|uniref:MFS transporter n=1 Tax=Nocardioides hwasunensis TaxID=397258 RepID=A0ABR8ME37_9ACTN|nr:VC0807 family protein [Nocardioides hwasunensis]MBD3914382.1 hypothetical protein [Nocardioides hwasunensis]
MSRRPEWVGTAVGVGQNVVLPIASYLLLVAAGWSPVWALAGSAAVSVLALAVDRLRGQPFNALGGLVLLRFGLSFALAWLTGNARVLLVKDGVITLVIAAFALWSLTWSRPLIARIRRDLSADRHAFDARLDTDPAQRRLHARLTLMWAAGLAVEATTSILISLLAPITAAVVITNITGPATIVALIAITEYAARSHRATPPNTPTT